MLTTIEIDCPPADVYAYATDPEHFAEWQRDVASARMATRPPAVGTRFTTVRRFAGAERTLVQEITELDAPRRWAARAVGGPVRPSATVTVEPIGDGARSRVTFGLDFAGHGLGVPLLPMVRRQAERQAPVSYRTLKQLMERR